MNNITKIVLLGIVLASVAVTAKAATYTYSGAQTAMNQAQCPVASWDTVDWNITSGYFGTSAAHSQTYANPNLIFTAVAQNNGWGDAVTRFSSATTVTGAGAFSLITAGLSQDFVFAGNMQGYSGNLSVGNATGNVGTSLALGNTGSTVLQYGGETAGGNKALGTVASDGSGNWINNVAGSGSITWRNVVFNYGTDASYDYVKVTNAINQNVSVNFIGNANVLASGIISGAGALNKSGTGTLTLSNANTYDGGTTVSAGTLLANNAAALGTANVTVNGTGVLKLNTAVGIRGLSNGSGDTAAVVDLNGQTLTIGNTTAGNSTAFYYGNLSGTGTIALRGGAATIVNADGTAGSANFQIFLMNTAQVQATSPFALDTGASATDRKDFGFINETGDTLTLSSLTGYGAIRNDAGATSIRHITVDQSGGDTTFNGALLSHRNATPSIRELTFEKKGTSALTLAGFIGKQTGTTGAAAVNLIANGGILDVTNASNTTTTNTDAINLGTVTVTSGTLGFANQALVNTAGTAGATSIAMDGGTLRWDAGNTQDITAGGRLTLVAGKNATFDTNGNDVTLATAFGGGAIGASVTKSGAGTLRLNAANSYNGPTTVAAGILAVDGSIASSSLTTVDSGATLQGTGTVGPALVNGHIAPGNSIGMLSVNGNLTISGTLDVEYDGGGSLIDLLAVTGNLNIGSATVDFAPLNSSLTGSPYIFATYGSLIGSQFASVVDLPGGYTIDYAYDNGTTTTNIALVPEPTVALLAGLGLLGLLRRRRA